MVAVNCGMVINVAWRMMKSLLDERTRNKINFIKGTKDILKMGIFDPDTLPVQYGGASVPFPPPLLRFFIINSTSPSLSPGNSDRTLMPGSYGQEYLTTQG